MGTVQSRMEQAAAEQAVNYAGQQLQLRWPQCAYLSHVRMVVGIVLVVAVWSACFANIGLNIALGLYLFLLSCICTLLEFSWILGKLTCCAPEGRFCQVWHFFLRLDSWKRGVFYLITSIMCFFPLPLYSFWAILAGMVLITAGVLYIAKAFQFTDAPQPPPQGGAQTPQGGQGGMQDPGEFSKIP